jgi:hypothetical protein
LAYAVDRAGNLSPEFAAVEFSVNREAVHLSRNGRAGGVGTLSDPVDTLEEALGLAETAGYTVIEIQPGEYTLNTPARVGTRLRVTGVSEHPVIRITDQGGFESVRGDLRLSRLRILGTPRGAVVRTTGGSVVMEDLEIRLGRSSGKGEGTILRSEGSDVVLRHLALNISSLSNSSVVSVTDGSLGIFETDIVVDAASGRTMGIETHETTVEMDDVSLALRSRSGYSTGISVAGGNSHITNTGLDMSGGEGATGIEVNDGTATLSGITIRTQNAEEFLQGLAVHGSSVDARNLRISGGGTLGQSGVLLDRGQLLLDETQIRLDGAVGRTIGIQVIGVADLEVRGSELETVRTGATSAVSVSRQIRNIVLENNRLSGWRILLEIESDAPIGLGTPAVPVRTQTELERYRGLPQGRFIRNTVVPLQE